MTKRLGKQTIQFQNPPIMISTGTVVGPFEGNSPLRGDFDLVEEDLAAGETSFEKAERELLVKAAYLALQKINTPPQNVEYFIAGDLLNQIISASFTALELKIPFFGIYGACSSSVEGLILSAVLIDGGFANLVMTGVSSHNCTAERQYRYPTEYGNQRKPFSQWTVTGAGTAVISAAGEGPRLTVATVGKVIDMACKDPQNMGAAMAPAAAQTIIQHFADTGRGPDYYDLILTGDLGKVGYQLAKEWTAETGGFDLNHNYMDCGMMIYDRNNKLVHAGGSGCGCSAVVVYGHIYRRLREGDLKKILLVATGALHSPDSAQQGENIPCIAHAVSLE